MSFELPKGLPEGPLMYHGSTFDEEFRVSDGRDRLVALVYSLEFARAVVRIPDMVAEIKRLRHFHDSCFVLQNEIDRLRALNAELLELIKPIAALPVTLTAPYSAYAATFMVEQINRCRAILSKATGDETK